MSMSQRLMDTLMDEGWKLLQKRVCRPHGQTQRGAGLGGVHTRRNAHTIYPLHSLGEQVPEQSKKRKCDDVKIQMISPAQATVEQAESEVKYIKKAEQQSTPHSQAKRRRESTVKSKSTKVPPKKKKYKSTKVPDYLK